MALPSRIDVSTVSIGRIDDLHIKGRTHRSAIRKQPVRDSVLQVTRLGIVGDEHADPGHHGGPEKAIYVYPFVHYAAWEKDYGLFDHDDVFGTGELGVPFFGENLTIGGNIDETMAHIGDRLAWGDEVILKITRPREPCFKFDRVMGKGASTRMKTNGRCGWYCSVERPGEVLVDAPLVFLGHDPGTPDLRPTVRDDFFRRVRKNRSL